MFAAKRLNPSNLSSPDAPGHQLVRLLCRRNQLQRAHAAPLGACGDHAAQPSDADET
jgi:hypothetical protein